MPDETGVIFGAHVPDEQRDVVAALEYATEALAPLPTASSPSPACYSRARQPLTSVCSERGLHARHAVL